MFSNLLESKPNAQRSLGGTLVSAVTHAAVIVLAIQATLHAGERKVDPATKVNYAEVKDDAPKPPKVQQVQVAPPPKGFQTLTAPVNIPDVLPEIDLTRPPTNDRDWLGVGAPGGRDSGKVVTAHADTHIFYESEVEKPVMGAPGSPAPRYPELLKSAGVEGEVVASFVVDTLGRADASTLKLLKSTNELFGAAVRTALPSMRFLPAEVGGRKVRQQVQQPFVFAIAK
jgi:protein TonB